MGNSEKSKVGILLVNLGTPDEPTAPAIRRYLQEFLQDPRVVNIPRLVWLPILFGFILPFRPKRLVHNYSAIWDERGGPIRHYTQALSDKLGQLFEREQFGKQPVIKPAMTYGNPSIAQVIEDFRQEGIDDLLLIPLFPQYSASTTGAVFDKLARSLARIKDIPAVRFVKEYHNHPRYVSAVSKSIGTHRNDIETGAKLIFSFHGLPEAQARAGDPYPERCRHTAELIADSLGLGAEQWQVTFQSRFGPAPWLQPYTSDVMESLPKEGVRSVVVVCPGFASDCLETTEEIEVENRDLFMAAGGESFTYVPALNDSDEHVELMKDLVLEHLYDSERIK